MVIFMEVNIRNFVGKPPLPNRRRPPTPNEPLSELQSNPSRDNYLLPKLMKMVTVQAHSLGKTHYTPSSEQLIDRSNMRKRNTASRETSQKPLSGKKASLKSEYSEEETDNEGRFGPQISASSWIIYEANRSKFIHGKRIFKKREIASLTKIMNLAVVIDTIRRCQLDARRLKVRVTR